MLDVGGNNDKIEAGLSLREEDAADVLGLEKFVVGDDEGHRILSQDLRPTEIPSTNKTRRQSIARVDVYA